MLFSYLVLAHLLGDFVLQPTKLVEWKRKKFMGLLVHSLVHVALNFLLLLPLFLKDWGLLAFISFGIGGVHLFIDRIKISYDYRTDRKVATFIIDQILHLLTLIFAYYIISSASIIIPNTPFYAVYGSQKLTTFLVLLVLCTTFYAIVKFQKDHQKGKIKRLKYNKRDMFFRVLTVSLIYALFLIVGRFFH